MFEAGYESCLIFLNMFIVCFCLLNVFMPFVAFQYRDWILWMIQFPIQRREHLCPGALCLASAASAVTRESCLVLSVLSSSQCSPPPSHHNLLLHRNLCLCPVFSAAHQLTSSCHQNTRHHQLTIITISWPSSSSANYHLHQLTINFISWPSSSSVNYHLHQLTINFISWPSADHHLHQLTISCHQKTAIIS